MNIYAYFSAARNKDVAKLNGEITPSTYINILKNFLIENIGFTEFDTDQMTIEDLFRIYVEVEKRMNKENELDDLIFMNLHMIGTFQNFGLTWETNEAKEEPELEYSEIYPDKLNKLVTKKKYDYEIAFKITIDSILEMKETLTR